MTPSWYDVLGVEPDADDIEIRGAWKASVADLDPTDRRFRLRNRAAEVLLDEDRRAAHDLELAAEVDDDEDEDITEQDVVDKGETFAGDTSAPEVWEVSKPSGTAAAEASSASRPRLLVTAALGVLAAVLLVAAVVSLTAGGSSSGVAASPSALPDGRQVATARAAAEAAVVPVLSYDYRKLEQDKQAALSYMTPKYAAEYEQLFASVIAVNAPSTQTVVSVEVLASGVVRTGEDLVDVLLFVNRPTTNKQQTTPEIYKDQATLRMRSIDGEWLVDCLISGSGSTCQD